jgi:hypothetical protein
MNAQNNILYLFFILFLINACWIIMMHKLFAVLKQRHLNKFKELENPSLFHGTLRSFILVVKFLYRADYKELGDTSLKKFGNIIRYFFIFDLLLIFALIFLIMKLPPKYII